MRLKKEPLNTIQETGKRLKLHLVISGGVFWVSLAMIFIGLNDYRSNNEDISPAWLFLVLGSLAWYIATKIRVWWHHK